MISQRRTSRSLIQYRSSNTRQFSAQINDQKIVTVSLETSSGTKELQIQKGEILRTAMLRRGSSPHNGRARLINCRGLGTCGTCAVEIEPSDNNSNSSSRGAVEPNERNTKEKLRLNFPPHGSSDQSTNLRLACQVQVMEDITVRKRAGFWGQAASELAEEYNPELWFGELEYVLDNKSPPRDED
jgi:ferredoxin